MKPKTRSNLSIIGSLLIGVSFFLPWFIVIFPELGPVSLSGFTVMQDDSALWGILLGAIVTFMLALVTRRKPNGIARFLQGTVHLGKSGFLVLSYLLVIFDKSSLVDAQQGAYDSFVQSGVSPDQASDLSGGMTIGPGIGFWLVAAGLLLIAIAIYAPMKKQQEAQSEASNLPERPLAVPSPAPAQVPVYLPCGHLLQRSNARFCYVCGTPVPPLVSV
jgi:hypothetical protein